MTVCFEVQDTKSEMPEDIVDWELFATGQLHKRQRRTLALTPEQRMDRFLALQSAAESTLAANPSAWQAFHRRNHRQRTESRVRLLEQRLRLDDSKAGAE